ncbi:MAG: TldD/PmbA family protein [Clostridia bacterium]|nr:TldD/PmbA family protein [Clostridia bacterium]
MISQSFAQTALELALKKGGDLAELYLEDTETHSLSLNDGEPENAASARKCGVGVRVLCGTKYYYTYSAGLSEKDILAAAEKAADAVGQGSVCGVSPFTEKSFGTAPEKPAANAGNARRLSLLKDAYLAAKSVDGKIREVKGSIVDSDKRVLICNSEGVFSFDRRPRVRFRVQAVARDGGDMQTGAVSPGALRGYEFFDLIDIKALSEQASREALTLLSARECPAGVFPVVIDGGFGGVIFHEACGHSLETTAVSRGSSEFCGKLGQKIASDKVTAIDDGTLPFEWGSVAVDDEGTPSQRNVLIEKGVLKSYLSDMIGARRMGISLTGSARRQDYTFAPTSRMTNTFIAPGTDGDEEMIRSVKEGLYAKTMGGGSVDPLTGEFNFAVSEGWWIRDGKLLCPVRGASLVGRGSEIIMNIDMVGKNTTLAAGICGSSSGSVPVNVGQPRIRVSSITVGGKGERP